MTLDGKSTLVPAVCGATSWTVAGGLGRALHFPNEWVAYVAIFLSALFAALMVSQIKTKRRWEPPIYWFLNTLIIVTISLGSTTTVETVQTVQAALAEPSPAPPLETPSSPATPPRPTTPAPPATAPAPPTSPPRPTPTPPGQRPPTPRPPIVIPHPPQRAIEQPVKEIAKEIGRRLKF